MDFKGVIKVKKVLHFVIGDAVKKKRKKSTNQFTYEFPIETTNQMIQNQFPIKAINLLILSINLLTKSIKNYVPAINNSLFARVHYDKR